MTIYGDKKTKSIARSVLPSTARRSAREDKREYHARHRHAQRQACHNIERSLSTVTDDGTIAHDPDLFDDFEDLDTFDGYNAATVVPSIGWDGMNEIVYNRRGHDKLGPLISWATAIEKREMIGWDVEDKVAYFKAVLPDTLQGRHALGHVEDALGLHTDPFRYAYRNNRKKPTTLEEFRAAAWRCLSDTKGRRALRDCILENVPVAAHTTTTNNKVRTQVQAVDENGNPRYLPGEEYDPSTGRMIRYLSKRPVMVDVFVPQIVSTTCADCAFLRNDPLATTDAINRFIEIVWQGRPGYRRYSHRVDVPAGEHAFLRKVYEHVYGD